MPAWVGPVGLRTCAATDVGSLACFHARHSWTLLRVLLETKQSAHICGLLRVSTGARRAGAVYGC